MSVQVFAGTTATEAGFWLPAGATTRVLVQAGSIAPTDGTFWPLMNNQRCLDAASESELSKPEWDYRSSGISRRRAARSHPDDASVGVTPLIRTAWCRHRAPKLYDFAALCWSADWWVYLGADARTERSHSTADPDPSTLVSSRQFSTTVCVPRCLPYGLTAS